MLEMMLEIVGEIVVDLIMMFALRITFDERVEYFERHRAKPTYFTYIGAAMVGALLVSCCHTWSRKDSCHRQLSQELV